MAGVASASKQQQQQPPRRASIRGGSVRADALTGGVQNHNVNLSGDEGDDELDDWGEGGQMPSSTARALQLTLAPFSDTSCQHSRGIP